MTLTRLEPYARFATEVTLSAAEIARFATAVGDTNPLHHDAAFARGAAHDDVIACGAHSSSLLMGLVADHISSRFGPMVGLDFRFLFRAPTPADEPLALEWLVIRVAPTRRASKLLVDLRGRLRAPARGVTCVGAQGRVLVERCSRGQMAGIPG